MESGIKKMQDLTGLVKPINISIARESRNRQAAAIARSILYPVMSIILFLLLWSFSASKISTSLGTIPGPMEVYKAAGILWQEHREERKREEVFFDSRYSNAENANLYVGNPTYIDQIFTSLKTVFTGFIISTLIAIPLGLLCGLNKNMMMAVNPLIQVFKPISPLAWLPIVTIVISSLYPSNDGYFEKSFIISAITVSLCSLWPSLINTAIGVDNIDKDYLNLAKAFQLNTKKKIFQIVLPAAMPLIFAGLRISLGVGWMVLIATEMLAQNPGLGKFIWDEFQNGSSNSLSKILVAVWTIGIIGFLLDRAMLLLQNLVNYSSNERS